MHIVFNTIYCDVDNFIKVLFFTMFWSVDNFRYSVDNFILWLLNYVSYPQNVDKLCG